MSFEALCVLRFFERFEMVMCMGGGPGVDRCLFWWVVLVWKGLFFSFVFQRA